MTERIPIADNITDWMQLKDSEYMGHWDLPDTGAPVKVVIESIHQEEVTNPKNFKKEIKTVVAFKGAKKRLILNVENMKAIQSWHGKNWRDAIGKPVELFRTTTYLKTTKEDVECVRIKVNGQAKIKAKSSQAIDSAK
jgi:hypothetical protein